MADISAIFGILLSLGIAFPGMLAAIWLLFPEAVQRAQIRLERTPWSCAWVGVGLIVVAGLPVGILIASPNGIAKLVGWVALALLLAVSTLGAAGLASKMGDQVSRLSRQSLSMTGAFTRGALALELAAVFPVVGWLIVSPAALVVSLGATAFALLRWSPASSKPTLSAPESMEINPKPL